MKPHNLFRLNRRDLLKWGGAALLGSAADLRPTLAFGQTKPECPPAKIDPCAGGDVIELSPTSPLIGGYVDSSGVVRGSAFTQLLPVLEPLAAEPLPSSWAFPGQQDSLSHSHQILPAQLGLPQPICYRINMQVAQHDFTSLKVLPIDKTGNPVVPPRGTDANPRSLPPSTIWGFNGKFPGSMIYARYGQPAVVHFENRLCDNTTLDGGDFGDPNRRSMVHLHNGHTAPESDGNPHYFFRGYDPGQFFENLYLNVPAGGDDNEKQSFLWFHDHKADHTGANVYKGLVGLYPIYDPKLDSGNENDPSGLQLPGVPRGPRPAGEPDPLTGRVDAIDYDIPLAFYDCALDDGITPHKDFHNGCGETHPEWWGRTFFRHFPDGGFVGDLFTVNGVAYPVLYVKRRKYRFRFLDASIARVYEFKLMSSTGGPQAAPGRQGQYQLPDAQQCMRFTQIASEGGLLPFPVVRDSFEIWPSKRREVVVDFSRYQDGSPTSKDDAIYLVNIRDMPNGRKPDGSGFDPSFCVPLMKIVIADKDLAPDNSRIPQFLRPLPAIDTRNRRHQTFELQRSGKFGGEIEWLVNDLPFQHETPLAFVNRGVPEIWTIKNGGGGWVHPMHFHQEEHRVLSRNGVPVQQTPGDPHPEDLGKEDTIALGPGDEVVIYRNFRTFHGPYVAHCHNLAHEDHDMMFGWSLEL